MEDLLTRIFENLLGRVSGPMKFRLILQPLMAILFAMRDGLKDAKKGSLLIFGPFSPTRTTVETFSVMVGNRLSNQRKIISRKEGQRGRAPWQKEGIQENKRTDQKIRRAD